MMTARYTLTDLGVSYKTFFIGPVCLHILMYGYVKFKRVKKLVFVCSHSTKGKGTGKDLVRDTFCSTTGTISVGR